MYYIYKDKNMYTVISQQIYHAKWNITRTFHVHGTIEHLHIRQNRNMVLHTINKRCYLKIFILTIILHEDEYIPSRALYS